MVLRKQVFDPSDSELVSREIILNQIEYDVNFPRELFDPQLPWRGGYALDASGDPIPVEKFLPLQLNPRQIHRIAYPPEGYDPSSARLTFEYPSTYNWLRPSALTWLFADQYFISILPFGNPWTVICQRSPDGKNVAFVSQPSQNQSPDTVFHWFSLVNIPSFLRTPFRRLAVTQFAFSPDSNSLAIFGYEDPFKQGKLYILDIETSLTRALIERADAKSLVWSPDGKSLAMIARYQASSYDDYVSVVDVETGEETYKSPVDYTSRTSTDWPMTEWGVEFPVDMGGLGACSAPPTMTK